ncbi:MAG: ATP synthase F0 subunit A [Deltaproteobacteria bacterium]|nr:ATP synthase F0 subunit A [Deltaproteobacteria bacterium]
MASGSPCMTGPITFAPAPGPLCDPHFTWLKAIPFGDHSLIEVMQWKVQSGTPIIGGMQFFKTADDAQYWLLAWVVCGILLVGSLIARMGLNKARSHGGTLQFVPDGSMTSRNFFELFAGALFGLATDLLGKTNAKKFFWIVGGLFIYILTSNLLGLLPGMLPPSGSLHHNFAMALVVLLLFNGAGLKAQGVMGYLKHMWGPVWWLGVLLFFIELLSFVVVRPYSLSLRLTGNMFGDHQVLSIMSGLIPVVYPVAFLFLGMFVSFIQAFVFTLLSTIYIALAVEHDDH